GAEGPGRRRALVRAFAPACGWRLRSVSGYARPGLPRDSARGAVDERRGGRNRRPGRLLQGQGGEHVLLLDLRRPDGFGPGPVPELARDSVSRLRPRSLRLDLAVPRLGPISVHGAQARPGPEVAGQAARRGGRRRALGSGAERR